ncbi:hypothetical protein BU16DRAFT_559102 [Lophium mytilinum]|uniref:MYND-type domain-containing protein n=1 Tax=Lophium mytilinum TaxID=390894 RepID=A0A6A6QY42_9PEZI|nr:hypothetical protein BU16DRAFT_559102 [Lophium mytilinum]
MPPLPKTINYSHPTSTPAIARIDLGDPAEFDRIFMQNQWNMQRIIAGLPGHALQSFHDQLHAMQDPGHLLWEEHYKHGKVMQKLFRTQEARSNKPSHATAAAALGPACPICKKPTLRKCAACERISYCSPECQREHWAEHKFDCKHVKRVGAARAQAQGHEVRKLEEKCVVLKLDGKMEQ